jgi:hypothetical protein
MDPTREQGFGRAPALDQWAEALDDVEPNGHSDARPRFRTPALRRRWNHNPSGVGLQVGHRDRSCLREPRSCGSENDHERAEVFVRSVGRLDGASDFMV